MFGRTNAQKRISLVNTTFRLPPQLDLPISYNIAPTRNVLAVRRNPETGSERFKIPQMFRIWPCVSVNELLFRAGSILVVNP